MTSQSHSSASACQLLRGARTRAPVASMSEGCRLCLGLKQRPELSRPNMRSGRCGQHMFVSGPRPLAHTRRGRLSPSARAPVHQHLAALRRAEAGVDAAALQLPGRAQAVQRVRAHLHPGHRLPPARGAPMVRATLIWCPARAAGAAWHAADRRVRRTRLPRCSRVRLQRRAQAGCIAELALTVKTARKPCNLAHGDARRKGGRA